MLLFVLMFFMEIRVMLLPFWLGPAEQLWRREDDLLTPPFLTHSWGQTGKAVAGWYKGPGLAHVAL